MSEFLSVRVDALVPSARHARCKFVLAELQLS